VAAPVDQKLDSKKLSAVAETLFIPLYFRAREARRENAILRDEQAEGIVGAVDYDFSHLKGEGFEHITPLMRAAEFDRCTRIFLSAHPNAVVVDIGCGLDTRFKRVDNGLVNWTDLDLPEVIQIRKRLLPEMPRAR
jgi:O-methyltransferase involved in polyketide biosynthesis